MIAGYDILGRPLAHDHVPDGLVVDVPDERVEDYQRTMRNGHIVAVETPGKPVLYGRIVRLDIRPEGVTAVLRVHATGPNAAA